jgi:hypothetical protein
MSSKEIQELIEEILTLDWEEEQIQIFKNLLDTYNYSRRLATRATKENLLALLKLFKSMKIQLEIKKTNIINNGNC